MAKSKIRKHAFICETCKGNGYVKIIHSDDIGIHQCWTCESQGELYVMSPKLLSLILMLIILQMMISSCTKLEFDGFDPTTSALKWIMKNDKNGAQ